MILSYPLQRVKEVCSAALTRCLSRRDKGYAPLTGGSVPLHQMTVTR